MPESHKVTEEVRPSGGRINICRPTFLSVSAPLWLFIILQDEHWWDYPGFELWKFVNLAVFIAVLIFAIRKVFGVPGMLKHRQETIKSELARAQQERDAAVAKLKEVEERLARLDSEVAAIREQGTREAAEERERIAKSTEVEVAKIGQQAQREIESAAKTAKHKLRIYASETSVRLAEEIIRREMKPEDDARLIRRNVQELGGAPQ